MFSGFPFRISHPERTLSGKVFATDRMCSCAWPHVCPGDRLRVLQKGHHISRWTEVMSSDHGCLELASRDEAFPTAGTSRKCALHLQIPHHNTDTNGIPVHGSQTALFFCVQNTAKKKLTWIAARVVSWYCSSLWL